MWLTVLGYCGIHDPRIPCRLRPRILLLKSRERLDHNQGLVKDTLYLILTSDEHKNVEHKLQSIEMWPTLPSPAPQGSDLISSLLQQYHSNPGNLIVFILFVEYVHSPFYSKLNLSLLSNLQQLICKPFFKDMPEVFSFVLNSLSYITIPKNKGK